jgi:hypothetical protein
VVTIPFPFLVVWLGALVLGLDVVWCACLGWACLRFGLPLFSCVCMACVRRVVWAWLLLRVILAVGVTLVMWFGSEQAARGVLVAWFVG